MATLGSSSRMTLAGPEWPPPPRPALHVPAPWCPPWPSLPRGLEFATSLSPWGKMSPSRSTPTRSSRQTPQGVPGSSCLPNSTPDLSANPRDSWSRSCPPSDHFSTRKQRAPCPSLQSHLPAGSQPAALAPGPHSSQSHLSGSRSGHISPHPKTSHGPLLTTALFNRPLAPVTPPCYWCDLSTFPAPGPMSPAALASCQAHATSGLHWELPPHRQAARGLLSSLINI